MEHSDLAEQSSVAETVALVCPRKFPAFFSRHDYNFPFSVCSAAVLAAYFEDYVAEYPVVACFEPVFGLDLA